MATYKDEKRGTWYCKFYYVDWTGTRRQKLKRGFKLQREAKEWERLFLEQFAKNPDITFEALYEKYLKFKENRIRPTTLANQRNAIELHILPHFKNKIVSEITPADIVEWQNIILAKGFTPSHTRLINTFLKMIFKYAVFIWDCPKVPSNRRYASLRRVK